MWRKQTGESIPSVNADAVTLKTLLRVCPTLTELELLGGAAWVRDQIDKAKLESVFSA